MESAEFIPELSPPVFSLLILTAFTHPRLVAFCSRPGLKVPGFRRPPASRRRRRRGAGRDRHFPVDFRPRGGQGLFREG